LTGHKWLHGAEIFVQSIDTIEVCYLRSRAIFRYHVHPLLSRDSEISSYTMALLSNDPADNCRDWVIAATVTHLTMAKKNVGSSFLCEV
jgi:hypothetical protein